MQKALFIWLQFYGYLNIEMQTGSWTLPFSSVGAGRLNPRMTNFQNSLEVSLLSRCNLCTSWKSTKTPRLLHFDPTSFAL